MKIELDLTYPKDTAEIIATALDDWIGKNEKFDENIELELPSSEHVERMTICRHGQKEITGPRLIYIEEVRLAMIEQGYEITYSSNDYRSKIMKLKIRKPSTSSQNRR